MHAGGRCGVWRGGHPDGHVPRCVARVPRNCYGPGDKLPASSGRRSRPAYRGRVRPLPRPHQGKTRAATPPDTTTQWGERALTGTRLGHRGALHGSAGTPRRFGVRCCTTRAPMHRWGWRPSGSAGLLHGGQLARARSPSAQGPLAATPMLGPSGPWSLGSSRSRLPALALVAGTIVASVAATATAGATGWWDRPCRPTWGRLRRVVLQVPCAAIPVPAGSRHKGVHHPPWTYGCAGHRRRQGALTPPANSWRQLQAA